MQQLLNDMVYYRSQQRRADRMAATVRLIILVTLCLTAYSCALNEQPAHAGEVSR